MQLYPGEREARTWSVVVLSAFAERVARPREEQGPRVVLIDGRSSGGKTTVAARLAASVPGAAVVHTDDLAWHHSRFGWEDLLVMGVLEPAKAGLGVEFRPPAWDAHGRPGAIVVPATTALLVIEGVGSARRTLDPYGDCVIWVQSDRAEAERRNLRRVDAGETDAQGLEGWMAEEVPFQASERTWERADWMVAGTPTADHDPATEIVVADGPRRRWVRDDPS